MTGLLQDLRFGLRLLRRQPGFAAVAVLVLTVGIGVNTAAFSLVNAMLLKPRPGGIDGELAGVYSRHRDRPGDYRQFSWTDYEELRGRRDLFRSLAAHGFGLVGLEEGQVTRRVFADIVSASYFETFGVAPVLGRAFTADEERPRADIPVAIVSHGLWKRLGGSPDVLGTRVRINTRPFTVVGVAPPGFGGQMVMVTPEVYLPTGVFDSTSFNDGGTADARSLADPAFRGLLLVARLPAGSTLDSAGVALAAASRQMAERDPAANADHELQLAALSRMSVSSRPQVDDEPTACTPI